MRELNNKEKTLISRKQRELNERENILREAKIYEPHLFYEGTHIIRKD